MTNEYSAKRLRLYLLRHGKAQGMEAGRLFGRTDVALSEVGLEQARLLAERLSSVRLRAIYSSDLSRASETAKIIAEGHSIHVQQDPAWREIDMGSWEGRSLSKLYDSDRNRVTNLFEDPASFQYPGGESFHEFTKRIQIQLDKLVALHADGDVALVTHAGVIRTIVGTVLQMPMHTWLRVAQGSGCMNIIDWYDATPSVQLLNDSLNSQIIDE